MANYVASPPTVSKVAAVLLNDKALVAEFYFFYNRLGLNAKGILDLKDEIRTSSGGGNYWRLYYSLFKASIHQWVQLRGETATIGSLVDILTKSQHRIIAVALSELFHRASVIQTPWSMTDSDDAFITAYRRYFEENETLSFVDESIKRKTRGGVKILDFLKDPQPDQPRVSIFISHLLRILTLPEVQNIPVVIASINGRRRSGKTFLLSKCVPFLTFGDLPDDSWLDAEIESSFEWRQSRESVTCGIQVWHDPFIIKIKDKKVAVILMDTQGLHDPSAGPEENTMIFALSAILSSIFIYNERGDAAEDSLEFMHCFLENAKFMTSGGNNSLRDASFQQQHIISQKLILLLRDFDYDDDVRHAFHDSETPSPNLYKDYFENPALHDKLRNTRNGIRSCFSNISVYAMAGYGNRRPDKPSYQRSASWDTDFRTGVANFIKTTFSDENLLASTKKVCGREVTGFELRAYAIRWAEMIKGASIMSHAMFEANKEIHYINEMETCYFEYKKRMLEYVSFNSKGVPASKFDSYHKKTRKEIIGKFCQGKKYGGENVYTDYSLQLESRIDEEKKAYQEANELCLRGDEKLAKAKISRIAKDVLLGIGIFGAGVVSTVGAIALLVLL